MKKILSMILAMTLLIGCAISASADGGDHANFMDSNGERHYLWRETSGDGWNYDEETDTLTLNNLTGIYLEFSTNIENRKLEIVLHGTNQLENLDVNGYDLIFSGDGSLTLTGKQDAIEYVPSVFEGEWRMDEDIDALNTLSCSRSITVNEGSLDISSKIYENDRLGRCVGAVECGGDFIVNGGSVNIKLPEVDPSDAVREDGRMGSSLEIGIRCINYNIIVNGGSINISVPAVTTHDFYRDIDCADLVLNGGQFNSNLERGWTYWDHLQNDNEDFLQDAFANGIITVKDGKTYIYKNGEPVTGTRLFTITDNTFALVKGIVKTGKTQTVTIGGKTYVVNKSGIVQKAKSGKKIVNVSKKSYIVNTSGVVQKSGSAKYKLIKAGKKYYIVNKSGLVQKNKKSIKIGKYVYKTSKTGVATRK